MNAETLRFRLWRCLWVQAHAFDGRRTDLGEDERQAAFALAVEEQKALTDQAEALGFVGESSWIEDYSLAALERGPAAQLLALEVEVPGG